MTPRLRDRALAVFVASTIVAACGSDAPTSTVTGLVQAGPSCPVEQPGRPCPPTPVTAPVVVTHDGSVVVRVTADAEGRFRVDLEEGVYTIEVLTAGLPSCPPTDLTVGPAPVAVTIDCDSGIR